VDADPKQIQEAIIRNWRMRTGTKLGRTLYFVPPSNWTDDSFTNVKDRYADLYIGSVDSVGLARRIVQLWNESL
jgi:hypothetical protein